MSGIPNLAELLESTVSQESSQHLRKHILQNKPEPFQMSGKYSSYIPMLLDSLAREGDQSHLIVCQNKEDALYLFNDIENLSQSSEWVHFLPEIYQKVKGEYYYNQSHDVVRTESLMRAYDDKKNIWVTYPQALVEKVEDFSKNRKSLRVKIGDELELDKLLEELVDIGFQREDFVYEPGSFSLRGDILDIYSFGNVHPYRIELFDNQVDSLRSFNPEDQLSDKKLLEVTIIPESQSSSSDHSRLSILDVIPEDTSIWMLDEDRIREDVEEIIKSHNEEIIVRTEEDTLVLNPENFSTWAELSSIIEDSNRINWTQNSGRNEDDITLQLSPIPIINKNFDIFIDEIQNFKKRDYEIYIFAENAKQLLRIQSILEDKSVEVVLTPVTCTISTGFVNHENKTAVFTDHQIFNRYHKYRVKQAYNRKKAFTLKSLQELVPGDFVIHIDHGIGRFSGLQTIEVRGNKQEAVRLLYKDNDILYVSTNSLHKISKYTGKDGKEPVVHKIGSDAWEKKKLKAKSKIKQLAFDLIKLYAQRKKSQGFSHSFDSYLQNELEASFYYDDTPDQQRVTQEVKEDMEKAEPMDRLVCGDVAFGKTEIAIRAAFKSVTDSKQVAVLVPTTILAYQHYNTFKSRLEDFPATVDYINRFKTAKEKRETLQKLKDGQIDIIVGTHALLSDKVEFKDLGLMIIDEEQKFGVGAKEKLKNFKVNVDSLTLTATPIPRTLQFSLMGARDLSIMSTPPPNRQPVLTEIMTFDEAEIKAAILYELERGGQVYFVHNRVQSLPDIERMIKTMVPSAKVVSAHGKLDGKELEKRLMSFINKKYDVLVSTNIIESGVDIPNANTIIINNAQHFGLSDLHQLRGRVGRSNAKAFCYLIAPPMSTLTQDSKKRLMALEQYSELGSGFQIAMRDLDIRGAGDIFGADQSGFIHEIGYEMYQKILNQTIRELKETEFQELLEDVDEDRWVEDCTIDTDMEVLIPSHYVSNIQERLSLYTRLDNVKDEQELLAFSKELKDRFGTLPEPVLRMIELLKLRWIAQDLGIERISIKNAALKLFMISDPNSKFYQTDVFQNMMQFIQVKLLKAKLKNTHSKFVISVPDISEISEIRAMMENMKNHCLANATVESSDG